MELHHAQRPAHRPARYVSPASLEDVLALLAEHQDRARLIAGGTDVMVEFDRATEGPELLIDLTRIDGLDSINQSRHGIHLGPLVTHNQCVASDLVRTHGAPLAQACWEVGSPALRNRATVVGNVVTASPANDSISALVALDAELTMISTRGQRSVAMSEFHTGVRQTVLAPDELVTGITFPALDGERRGLYLKLGLRRAQAISVVHLAVVVSVDDRGVVDDSRIVIGSVAPTVDRVDEAEAIIDGSALGPDTIGAAARAAAEAVAPIDDLRAPADHRVDQVEVMVRRALVALAEPETSPTLPASPPMLGGPALSTAATPGTTIDLDASGHLRTTVDGVEVEAPWSGASLLRWLRDDAGVITTKEGCAEGECGACTVMLDGTAVLSCLVPAGRAEGTTIRTAAGVGGGEKLSPLQERFIDAAAVQCGFCIPGFIVAGSALEAECGTPTDEQIKQGLAGNLCRCTGYYKIEEAFR